MREYYVSSLGEYFAAIEEIAESDSEKRKNEVPLLWFRGLTENYHMLLPTLYRKETLVSSEMEYNLFKQKEDTRYQHFKSRTYHLIKTNPDFESEWLEIYQHHEGKTRLMDWSESAKTALSFAVEAFLDSRGTDDLKKKRETITPTVTVINPTALNRIAYRYFIEHEELVCNALKDLMEVEERTDTSHCVCDCMRKHEDSLFAPRKGDTEMAGIVSLCVLEDMRNISWEQLKRRISEGEINPYYYLILRYYTDALPVCIEYENQEILPPLAILHPYHSERIRKQRGVFTIFPNYVFSKRIQELYDKRNIDVRVMEHQKSVNPLLNRIYIMDAQRVAKELLYAGERRTELYPGLNDYANLLETTKFFV